MNIPREFENYDIFSDEPLVLAELEISADRWLERRKSLIAWIWAELHRATSRVKTPGQMIPADVRGRIHLMLHYLKWLDIKHGFRHHCPSFLDTKQLGKSQLIVDLNTHPLVEAWYGKSAGIVPRSDLQKKMEGSWLSRSKVYPLSEGLKQTFCNRVKLASLK